MQKTRATREEIFANNLYNNVINYKNQRIGRILSGACNKCIKKTLVNKPNSFISNSKLQSIVYQVLTLSGQQLNSNIRDLFEPRFGHNFSKVQIHTNGEAADAAHRINARAFTLGQNIYFGAGEYNPESREGKRLLAHELAHTVQQRNVSTSGNNHYSTDWSSAANIRLETEANRVAKAVVAGQPARVIGSIKTARIQREEKHKQKIPTIVPPVQPNKMQKKMIDEARRAAAIRTQIARFKASGLQGIRQYYKARNLAQIKFDWADPNMEQISDILGGMGAGLISIDVKAADTSDPECGLREGYVRNHRAPIVLCPRFFKHSSNTEGRIRTMIHEMAHVKGIGKADINEQYFPVFDCTSKGEFESADSWANYVHCLSDQIPDKADEIVLSNGRNKTGKQVKKKQVD